MSGKRKNESIEQDEQAENKTLLQRLSVVVFVYAALFLLYEFAHGQLDRLWSMTAQLSSLAVFGFIPLMGAFFLWSKNRRFGGILILGSLPSSILFMIMDRFVEKRLMLPPGEVRPIWEWIFNGSYFLVLICAAIGALLSAQLLRKLHAESQ